MTALQAGQGGARNRVTAMAVALRAPVTRWAVVGAASLSLGCYVMACWLAAGDVGLTMGDRRRIGFGSLVFLRAVEAGTVLLVVAICVGLAVQWRRQRRLTCEAALFAGYATTFWLDPLLNYGRSHIYIGVASVHMDSWGRFIPGWHSTHGADQIEAVFGNSAGYPALLTPFLLLTWLLRGTAAGSQQRPRLVVLVTVLLASTLVAAVFDSLWVPAHVYAFPHRFDAVTLFPGAWYRISLATDVVLGVFLFAIPWWHRYTQAAHGPDAGIWRGTDRLPAWARTPARVLATVGLVHLCFAGIGLTFWLLDLLPGQSGAGAVPPPGFV